MTAGTGSGKTETFLLPILGRIAAEAMSGQSFSTRAVRALLLYPMNALVNDQLGRLRVLFGDNSVTRWFTDRGRRPMKFARYTGRTLYPGRRKDDTRKHWMRLKEPLEFFTKLEDRAASDAAAKRLIGELRRRGKWPAKPPHSLEHEDGVSTWLGTGPWKRDGEWIRAHSLRNLVPTPSSYSWWLKRAATWYLLFRTRSIILRLTQQLSWPPNLSNSPPLM